MLRAERRPLTISLVDVLCSMLSPVVFEPFATQGTGLEREWVSGHDRQVLSAHPMYANDLAAAITSRAPVSGSPSRSTCAGAWSLMAGFMPLNQDWTVAVS